MIDLTPDLIYDLVSMIVVPIAIVISFINWIKAYRSYKRNKVTSTLLFSLFALFAALAMLFLIFEKLFLSDLMYNEFLGLQIFGSIAVIISGIALTTIDAFAYNMAFTNRYKILTALSAILAITYLSFFMGDPTKQVIEDEISFLWDPFGWGFPITWLIILITSIIMIAIPIIIFFYYSIKIKNKSAVRAKRAAFLGLGFLVFGIAYIIELLGLDPIITTPIRSLYILANLLLYYSIFRIKEKT
ncbi:MAG: hypothetical protein ACTSRP_11945 [Candidatus Helarchaeota archaeon]